MKKVLITGANSFVGTSVEKYLLSTCNEFEIDTVDTMNEAWKKADFSKYDVVFHVAGIAHVDPKPEMAHIYYKVNRDLAIEIGKWAKKQGVHQFIFMSSKIVYHASKSLKGDITTLKTKPNPNDFYGDSKLQAEIGLTKLADENFKVAILRPCMIYGPNSKGNFMRLVWLSTKSPIFPAWHNKRSMLYIDNLSEFVKQVIINDMSGVFFPQNRELVDTVEVVRLIAKKYKHKIWISRIFNPLVWFGSFIFPQIPKMFSSSYYSQEMSRYNFNYQLVSFEDSIEFLTISYVGRKKK